jgi:hypothetical protein
MTDVKLSAIENKRLIVSSKHIKGGM